MQNKIELGMKYRDHVTGFEGVAVSYTQYLGNATGRVQLQPQGKTDKLAGAEWLDEVRVKKIE